MPHHARQEAAAAADMVEETAGGGGREQGGREGRIHNIHVHVLQVLCHSYALLPCFPPHFSSLPPPLSQGCQRNTEDWQRILHVRSIVLSQQEEIQSWVKFASMCCKLDKMALFERMLCSILSHNPTCNQEQPISEKYPHVCVQCACSPRGTAKCPASPPYSPSPSPLSQCCRSHLP